MFIDQVITKIWAFQYKVFDLGDPSDWKPILIACSLVLKRLVVVTGTVGRNHGTCRKIIFHLELADQIS